MEAIRPGAILEITVPDRLKLARIKAGYEQAELADMIGVSRNNVSDYESNAYTRKRKPSTIKRWAWACGFVPSSIDPSLGDDPDGGSTLGEPPTKWYASVRTLPVRQAAPLAAA